MSDRAYIQHGRRHGPQGSDPIPGNYVDDRTITDPVDVVTFDAFPADGVLLELTWVVALEDYPAYLCMTFGDYPPSGNDYRWRMFGNVTADDTSDDVVSDNYGVIGGSFIDPDNSTSGPHWGGVRFPDYNGADSLVIWQGDGGLSYPGNTPDTFLISGAGDPTTPLTQINVFAVDDSFDPVNIVSPSRLTLTCF